MQQGRKTGTGLTLAVGLVLGLAGCQLGSYGQSAPYHYSVETPIRVTVPANAPSVIQQFRPLPPEHGRKTSGEHPGIDIYETRNTPILAAAPGTVIASYREPSYGNRVVIAHPAGPQGVPFQTVYKHLNSRTVQKGDAVKRGQQIGGMGNTGILAAGIVHLHFELHEMHGPHAIPRDPHLFWANGPGRVTCFSPQQRFPHPNTTLTYPVRCK